MGRIDNTSLDESIINFVNKYFNSKSKILDVGAGRGKFGRYFRRYHKVVDALEISKVKEYAGIFNLKSIYKNVHACDALDFDYGKDFHDLIILGNTLEQFTVEEAQGLLKKMEEANSSIVVKVSYLYKGESDDPYEKCKQRDLTREVMFNRYPNLELLRDNKKFGIYYQLAKNAEIRSLAIILGHIKYYEAIKHLNWTKKFFNKVAYVRNTSGMPVIEDVPEFLNIDVPNSKTVPDRIMGNFYNIFKDRYDPFYYFILEWDALVVDLEFERKCIDFMERTKIDALFPNLCSNASSMPNHPFAQRYPSMLGKQWSNTNCIVINKIALDFYINFSFDNYPEFWCEMRFPTTLNQEGFLITQNPFIYRNACTHLAEGELDEYTVKKAIDWGTGVLHPIKTYDKFFPFIEGILKEKGKVKT